MKSPKKPGRMWVDVLTLAICLALIYFGSDGEWRWAAFMALVYMRGITDRRLRYRRFIASGGEAAAQTVRAMAAPMKRRPVWVDVLVVVLFAVCFYFGRDNKWMWVTLFVSILVAALVDQHIRDKRFFARCSAALAEQPQTIRGESPAARPID